MQALKDLYKELVALYGYARETSMAFRLCQKWIQGWTPEVQEDARVLMGQGPPDRPLTTYTYTKTHGQLISDFAEDGPHSQLHRKSVIALAYAMWEEGYRDKIARECDSVCKNCGSACKNCIESDVFQELNWYRQAILHNNSKLDRTPKIMDFFARGDTISFTNDQMFELFTILINELNQIGKTHYGEDPQFVFKEQKLNLSGTT